MDYPLVKFRVINFSNGGRRWRASFCAVQFQLLAV